MWLMIMVMMVHVAVVVEGLLGRGDHAVGQGHGSLAAGRRVRHSLFQFGLGAILGRLGVLVVARGRRGRCRRGDRVRAQAAGHVQVVVIVIGVRARTRAYRARAAAAVRTAAVELNVVVVMLIMMMMMMMIMMMQAIRGRLTTKLVIQMMMIMTMVRIHHRLVHVR